MNDRSNPVFVYEIRQAVRNRTMLAALCVYLLLLAGTVGHHFYTVLQSGGSIGYDGRCGSELARKLLSLLGFYSFGTVALYSVVMTIRQGFEEELIYLTRLDWYRTACGKIQAAALLMLLFYAVTLPLLTLAWMMRGVDLLPLGFFLLVLFGTTQCLTYYLTAAVVCCRNWTDVVAAAAGLLLASPPCLFVYGTLHSMAYVAARSDFGVLFMPGWPAFFQMLVWILVPFIFTTFFAGEMFKTNWQKRTVSRRFAKAAAYVWFSVLLSTMFGGFFTIVFSIVIDFARTTLGL